MTKAFRFRLDRLLSLRRIEERDAEGRSREATLSLRRIEDACDALRAERTSAFSELGAAARQMTARPDGPRLVLEHGTRLDDLLNRREEEREAARKRAAEAEAVWRRARTARRALEEIAERARTEWRAAADRDEAAFMDEIASGRFASARRS